MLGAIFPEGPCPSALSQRYFGTPVAVRPLIQERQRRSRSTYDVCARSRDGYERPASNNAPGRRAFCLSSPHPARLYPPEVLDSGGGAFFEAAEGRLFRRQPVIKEEVDQP